MIVPYEIDTLDPHARNALFNYAVNLNLYETLVTSDAEMRLAPGLAERWENPDLLTWVFHLRRNVRFHDGRKLEAADVVYSFERLLHRQDLEMAGYLIYIDRIEALDQMTVRIRTTRPLAILLNKIRFVAIIPRGASDAELSRNADGTGPFRIGSWRGNVLKLVRNERYWGPAVWASDVTMRLAASPAEAIEALRGHGAQLVQCNSRRLLTEPGLTEGYRIERRPNIFVKYLGYDLLHETTPGVAGGPNPFRDLRIRQALDLALDRRQLVDALPIPAVPASQLVPPFIFGFDPSIRTPAVDLLAARRLLASAGYPNGFDVAMDVRQIFEPAARNVQMQLARIGIRADLRVEADRDFFTRANAGVASFHVSRFGCTTGDISDILDNVLHTPDPTRHFGIHNWVGYSNPTVDREIEESAGIYDVSARREVLQQIVSRAMADLVWIPLYVDEDIFAIDPALSWRPRNDGIRGGVSASR
jgi:peptide/nickel transport system substrate-binding protein